MIHFRRTHGVRLGLSDLLGGTPRGIAELIALTKQLPLDPTRVILSNIQTILSNENGRELELKMRRVHFSPQACEAIEQFSKAHNVTVHIFTEMAILLVQEVFRQHHDLTLTTESYDPFLPILSEAILVANDICNEITKSPENAVDPESYSTFALREMLFNYSDQFRYTIGRSYAIYEALKERCRSEYPNDFFDVSQAFQDCHGISLRVYFHCIFAIYGIWGSRSFDKIDPNYNIINPTSWIEDETVRPIVNEVIQRCSQPWIPNRTTITATTSLEKIRSFLYELFPLRQRPLLEVGQNYICGNLNFILRKYWDGPYYEIIDSSLSDDQKERFFRYLGRTTEMYVQSLLKGAFGGRFGKLSNRNGNPLADAVVCLNPNWRLIFEVKAKRPTRDMISGDEAPATLESVSQMMFEGLAQLDGRIQECIADGYTGRITPILVTGGPFPINKLLWSHYLPRVQTLRMFASDQVDWPQVMNLEGIEVLTALASKVRVGDMLRAKVAEDWKMESFQTFLFANYLPANSIKEPFNPVSESLYHDRMADLSRTLFPTSSQHLSPNNSWKRHFGLE